MGFRWSYISYLFIDFRFWHWECLDGDFGIGFVSIYGDYDLLLFLAFLLLI